MSQDMARPRAREPGAVVVVVVTRASVVGEVLVWCGNGSRSDPETVSDHHQAR
jgi:hypothetical protein